MIQRIRQISRLSIAVALLTACAGAPQASAPTAQPTSAGAPTVRASAVAPTTVPPAPSQAAATQAPVTAAPSQAAATQAPAPAGPSTTAQPAALPLATVEGQVMLKLGVGSGAEQVGVDLRATPLVGPRSFRIGADGSIRVLDNVNKRVLFFKDGTPRRALGIAEAQDPWDFSVNNAGEVFVFDKGGSRVLRYGPDGNVTATIPLGEGVSSAADGLMLTAAQDLMLVQQNQLLWTLVHQGVTVPPPIQSLTRQAGAATPRSPALFQTTLTETGAPYLHVVGLTSGVAGDMMADVDGLAVNLPADARFFNVDRAMNLYFTRTTPDADAVDLWRVLPNGTAAGGAHILTGACGASWRALYVDQAGAAWTMCVGDAGATITRYTLLDTRAQPLPEAAKEAADVSWKPGALFSAA